MRVAKKEFLRWHVITITTTTSHHMRTQNANHEHLMDFKMQYKQRRGVRTQCAVLLLYIWVRTFRSIYSLTLHRMPLHHKCHRNRRSDQWQKFICTKMIEWIECCTWMQNHVVCPVDSRSTRLANRRPRLNGIPFKCICTCTEQFVGQAIICMWFELGFRISVFPQ